MTRNYQGIKSQKLVYGVLGMGRFQFSYVEVAAAYLASVPQP
jgi:hypothetical protein